jgi:hypothetical protein
LRLHVRLVGIVQFSFQSFTVNETSSNNVGVIQSGYIVSTHHHPRSLILNAVMFHIILTSESLLMSQSSLR